MAPGATSDFEQTRDEIIRDALANVGAVGPDKTPTGSQLAHAQRALNRVVKSIDPAGETLWRIVRRTTTTTRAIDYFDLATDVLSIDEPFDFDTGADTPDFPAEWTDCLVNGLSAALAPVYLQPGLMQVFDAKFNAHLGALMQAETEHGNVVFVPFGRG